MFRFMQQVVDATLSSHIPYKNFWKGILNPNPKMCVKKRLQFTPTAVNLKSSFLVELAILMQPVIPSFDFDCNSLPTIYGIFR